MIQAQAVVGRDIDYSVLTETSLQWLDLAARLGARYSSL
ncbi:hypothetical protein DR96_672 [Providencia stuartii]|nr:hypothetical protein DR96_672 [Providencia stuartii]